MLWSIGTILFGLVVGIIAKLLLPGKDPGGMIVTILIGIAGSFIGSFLGRFLGWYCHGEAAGFMMSVVGAILLLIGYRVIAAKKV